MNKAEIEKKNKNRIRFFIIATICIVVVIAAIIALVVGDAYSKSFVASVGSEKITVPEFRFFLKQQKVLMLSIAGSSDTDTFWNTQISGERAIDIAKGKALDNAKEFKIQLSKAKEAGVFLAKTDKDLVKTNHDAILKNNNNSATAANQYCLVTYGITYGEYSQILSEVVIYNKFRQAELNKITVTDAETKAKFDADPRSYDKVSVRSILYLTTDATTGAALSDDKIKLAETSANDMLARVKAGEDMQALALQYSQDPTVKDNSGLFTFDKYEAVTQAYDTNFSAWALKASVGDASVVKTSQGYQVVKLEKRDAPGYDNVKSKISDDIKSENLTNQITAWVKDPKYTTKYNNAIYNSIN